MNRRTPQVRWPLALPDLRPYLNLGALARPLGAGTVILARKTCAWCAAGQGSGAVAARAGGALFGVLCAGEAVTMYPAAAPSILVGGWLIASIVAGRSTSPPPPATPTPPQSEEGGQQAAEEPPQPAGEGITITPHPDGSPYHWAVKHH